MNRRAQFVAIVAGSLASCVTPAGVVGRQNAACDGGACPLDCTSLAIAPAASASVTPLPLLAGPLTLEGYVSVAGAGPTDVFYVDSACAGTELGVSVNVSGSYAALNGTTVVASGIAASSAFVHVALVVTAAGAVTFYVDGAVAGNAGVLAAGPAGCPLQLGHGVVLGTLRVSSTARYVGAFVPPLELLDDASTAVIVDADTNLASAVRGGTLSTAGNVRIVSGGPRC